MFFSQKSSDPYIDISKKSMLYQQNMADIDISAKWPI